MADERGQVHPAVHRAREVVGLYGDPTVTWGILSEVVLDAPIVETMDDAVQALFSEHPHLGAIPVLERVSADRWSAHRARVATRPYGDAEPLVRLALDEPGRRLLVGAHHGVVDGLGLLAVAGRVSGRRFTSHARGIGAQRSRRGFVGASLGRVAEAVWRPPTRVAAPRPFAPVTDEVLISRTLPRSKAGTAELLLQLSRTVEAWNTRAGLPVRRQVFTVGASRREPGALAPDRQTGYLRLTVDPSSTPTDVRAALRAVPPEPDFPQTSAAGLGPAVTRLLRPRLGATALVSNLGVVTAEGVREVRMYPAISGPRAVAVGYASTDDASTLTLRTRGNEFAAVPAHDFLGQLASRPG